jgi:hypothetical protein
VSPQREEPSKRPPRMRSCAARHEPPFAVRPPDESRTAGLLTAQGRAVSKVHTYSSATPQNGSVRSIYLGTSCPPRGKGRGERQIILKPRRERARTAVSMRNGLTVGVRLRRTKRHRGLVVTPTHRLGWPAVRRQRFPGQPFVSGRQEKTKDLISTRDQQPRWPECVATWLGRGEGEAWVGLHVMSHGTPAKGFQNQSRHWGRCSRRKRGFESRLGCAVMDCVPFSHASTQGASL